MANNFPPLVCIAVSVPLLKKGLIAFLKEEFPSFKYHILDDDSFLAADSQRPEPDVLILDAPRLAALTQNASAPPLPTATKTLLIAPHSSLPVILRAVQRITIHAWLPLEIELEKLAKVIQFLLDGRTDFTSLPEMLDTFLRERPLRSPLSNRERQVLTLIALGYENARISEQLALQPGTIKNYVTMAYQKIGVKSRAGAVVYMWKNPDLFLLPGAEVTDDLLEEPPPQG
ncbi:response regulator containing a CheY-like receiver domain and an HTH DNA-binding domain [Bellilinea caldifistulae]|uniref:HTH luxR-type domain-containing protein n=1 Tax=Bellilinea caldifistulae TaxID=360411 RepID=A0A0P6XVH6_9CHLR|nr:response regulator transcription factor [Bellilinea caldifistulae]KPL79278.1 hypothetical protein AC812_00170 [Bellilinea caldifistulae]GAP09079.1 response regulator containing a CheY-like receiver domain and an HTH DNA-binding domain [Bellilinea caldifistulae]